MSGINAGQVVVAPGEDRALGGNLVRTLVAGSPPIVVGMMAAVWRFAESLRRRPQSRLPASPRLARR